MQGGKRLNAGRKTRVPVGKGELNQVTVKIGEDLLGKLRAKWPEFNHGELIRAAVWQVVELEDSKVGSSPEHP